MVTLRWPGQKEPLRAPWTRLLLIATAIVATLATVLMVANLLSGGSGSSTTSESEQSTAFSAGQNSPSDSLAPPAETRQNNLINPRSAPQVTTGPINWETLDTTPEAIARTNTPWALVYFTLTESVERVGPTGTINRNYEGLTPVTALVIDDPYAIKPWDQALRYVVGEEIRGSYVMFPSLQGQITTSAAENGNLLVEARGSVRLMPSGARTTITEREDGSFLVEHLITRGRQEDQGVQRSILPKDANTIITLNIYAQLQWNSNESRWTLLRLDSKGLASAS